MTALKRRWFRFSLSKLFVAMTFAAIPIGGLAWNFHQVHEREQMLLLLKSRGATFESADNQGDLPLLWIYLAAQRQAFIIVPQGTCTDAELQRARYLCPDAVFVSAPSYDRIFP